MTETEIREEVKMMPEITEVGLWCKNQGTIFVEPPLLAAIQERISELNF